MTKTAKEVQVSFQGFAQLRERVKKEKIIRITEWPVMPKYFIDVKIEKQQVKDYDWYLE